MMNSIHSDMIRGHIDTIILSILQEGDRYGYDIISEIEKKSGGEYAIKQPTLYSCLKRLESQGFIYKYWGTETNGGRRTYYSLTEMGKELFRKNQDEWRYSRLVIDKLISTPEELETEVLADKPSPATDEDAAEEVASSDDKAVDETASESTEETTEIEEVVADEEQNEEQVSSDDTDVVTVTATAYDSDEQLQKEYAETLAVAEKDELLAESGVRSDEVATAVSGYSYADRLTQDADQRQTEPESEPVESTYFADNTESYDEEEEEDEADEEITEDEDDVVAGEVEIDEDNYPDKAFYNDDDFSSKEKEVEEEVPEERPAVAEKRTIFKRYDDADISEETDRQIIVGREYRGVIKRLLHSDIDEDNYYIKIKRQSEEPELENEEPIPVVGEPIGRTSVSESSTVQSELYESSATRELADDNANFDDLLVSGRSMGDEIRIRTHSREVDKEYNSLYHYYSNKLMLFKYGIIFGLMILEILIPYLIIKFGVGMDVIYGELPFLILFTLGAASLPVYSVIAYVLDPYKRKRYDFDLRTSLLYRFGIMLLVLILIYAANVVLYMDISFDADYLFSLITPALMSTNIPVSALLFKALYDTKNFGAE